MVGVPALAMMCDLRPVGADRLALALPQAQAVDDGRARTGTRTISAGDHRAAGAEGDVAEDVEDGELVGQFDEPIEHRLNLVRTRFPTCHARTDSVRSALTIGPMREPSEPLTMTASPAPTADSTCGSSAAESSA